MPPELASMVLNSLVAVNKLPPKITPPLWLKRGGGGATIGKKSAQQSRSEKREYYAATTSYAQVTSTPPAFSIRLTEHIFSMLSRQARSAFLSSMSPTSV